MELGNRQHIHINIYQYISIYIVQKNEVVLVPDSRCLQGLIEPQRLLRLLTLFLLSNSGPCFLYMAQLQFSPFYYSQVVWYSAINDSRLYRTHSRPSSMLLLD